MTERRRRAGYLAVRGAADRIIAGVALLVLSPVAAVVAISIRRSMGSPVLFRQVRVGRDGRSFEIVKFRTMVNGAEQLGGGYMVGGADLVPPLGRFLRKSSLDEIPQLINILKGDMGIIGPRPALPDQVERYTPEQAGRLAVPQGLTGLAQVRYRNDATWSVRIASDLEYIERLGPVMDAKIIVATIARVLTSQGVRLDQSASDVDDLGELNRKAGDSNG